MSPSNEEEKNVAEQCKNCENLEECGGVTEGEDCILVKLAEL